MTSEKQGVAPKSLEFFLTPVRCPGGGERQVVLAFGADGTMWIDPRELGIGPHHAPQLARFPGGLYLLINLATRQVMINARAVVLAVNNADWCRDWLAYVERMIQEHKEVRARYESARNN